MNYIPRSLEARLRKYEKTYKAILVTGPRQVGKSTLLKKVFADRKYVSLDDPFIEEQAREAGNMFLTLNPPSRNDRRGTAGKGVIPVYKNKM